MVSNNNYERSIMSILNKMKSGLFLVLMAWQLSGQAQDVKMFSGKVPSAEEMGEILFSETDAMSGLSSSGIKMRSISFGKPNKPGMMADAEKKQNLSIGLPIKFAYNSALVLDESKTFLNEIGIMLTMPSFVDERLVIEGHTDARGSENYNQRLSARRAQSVKKYLENKFDIAENRMVVAGMGESEPLPDVNPNAAINRRVQFRKAP